MTSPRLAPMTGLLPFLDHVELAPDFARRRARSYDLLAPRPGETIVDVGCGAGTAVRELAARVAPGGAVVGVDVNEALVQTATERAAQAGVDVAFRLASAPALPFAAASLHGYRAERLYQHLPEPAQALAEALRVLAPGGRIVLIDQDWDTAVLDSDDTATTRLLLRRYSDGGLNGAVARRYHRLLADAGFADVKVEADAIASTSFDEYGWFPELVAFTAEASGALAPAVVEAWIEDQRDRGRRGRFFLSMTHFIASARR